MNMKTLSNSFEVILLPLPQIENLFVETDYDEKTLLERFLLISAPTLKRRHAICEDDDEKLGIRVLKRYG